MAAGPGVQTPPEEPVAGRPAEIAPARTPAETIWLEPGVRLRAEPDGGSRSLALVDVAIELPVLERRPGWARVRYGDRHGWVALPGGAAEAAGERASRTAPDPWRLARAREVLGGEVEAGRLGPFRLYTDLADRDLLRFLGRVAAELPAAYRARYGLDPGPPTGEVVVLFAGEASYREYDRETSATAGLRAGGHAGRGLVALFAGGKERRDVAAVLVHELTHLLNRRALGPALPPWLDEGLADDLAVSRLEDDGTLATDRLGGVALREPGRWEWRGPLASAIEIRRALEGGRLPGLSGLVALDWAEFVAPPEGTLRYALSSFWVRQLLSGEPPELAAGFRDFLAAVARGEPATGEELARRLGRSWPRLEADLHRWIVLRLPQPVEVTFDADAERP